MNVRIDNFTMLAIFLFLIGIDYLAGLPRWGKIVIGVVALVLGIVMLLNGR